MTSYKRDGTGVATLVWFVQVNGRDEDAVVLAIARPGGAT